ncbi:hypothetical protein GCM10011386_36600 [Parapedobacter defluvii]|uniref:Uncharacterized protein n=1 Tax=Parapedobacter defluvii TaxID=2045106 RepID=A0ABQ1MIS3_9SPHI|nr:hypothetical protein GCM10011386_36600 [Parapedobacter defluvii]
MAINDIKNVKAGAADKMQEGEVDIKAGCTVKMTLDELWK